MLVILFLIYVILSSSGLVLFKLGSLDRSIILSIFNFNISFSIKMLLGIFCYGASFLLWLYLVSKMNLSFAMPLSVALVNTLVIVESCIFLKEEISYQQLIGIFIIIVGVMTITWGRK